MEIELRGLKTAITGLAPAVLCNGAAAAEDAKISGTIALGSDYIS